MAAIAHIARRLEMVFQETLRGWHTRALLFAILIGVINPLTSKTIHAAEQDSALENRVKAAYLYRFAGYVDWPAASFSTAEAPLTIGVMASDQIAAELEAVTAGRTVNGRKVSVRRVKAGEPLAGIHILFIGMSVQTELNQITKAASQLAILTVTESMRGLTQGGVINFVLSERRVRFEISLEAAEKNKLKLSSRLLAVAHQVHTGIP